MSELSPERRFADVACQFELWRRGDGDDNAHPSGVRSPVYGGRYDTWSRCIIGPADPAAVVVLPASEAQYELATMDAARIEANGGRGSGKSEGGVLRAIRFICERPDEAGQCVSPVYDQTLIIWAKLLGQIPGEWLRPGVQGIRRSERTLYFVNGASVRFRSADNPDSLRSWGGGWTFVDEEQDVTTEAIGVIWPSLRKSASPSLWTVGTPKSGEYRDRHDLLIEDKTCRWLRFDSYSNPFISHAVFDLAKRQMTPEMYRQEILAHWADLDEEYVARRWFDPKVHGMQMPPPREWMDITRQVASGKRYVAGVDYNLGPPNIAWIYRVFSGTPRRWVLVDIVVAAGESSYLGQAMTQKGYTGDNTLVIDDASGEFNRYGGKRSANSSCRLMRSMGYTCVHPKKNPLIKDRVNALLVKLAPVEGGASWFYDMRLDVRVREVMTKARWNNNELSKSDGVDHDFDAGTYPLHWFEPPARMQIPTIGHVAA